MASDQRSAHGSSVADVAIMARTMAQPPGQGAAVTDAGSPALGASSAPHRPRHSRIAILTSTLGAGHLRAAQAIEVALRQRSPGAEVRILDFWSLMDADVAQSARQSYLRLVAQRPDLYDRLYQLDRNDWCGGAGSDPAAKELLAEAAQWLRATSAGPGVLRGGRYLLDQLTFTLLRAMLAAAASGRCLWVRLALLLFALGRVRLARRLSRRLRAFAPDVVLATQMHPAALYSYAKVRGWIDAPALGVLTDFGRHDFWLQSGMDGYCVPHEAMVPAPAGSHSGVPMVATGIPLLPGFSAPAAPEQARRQLGLDPELPVVLVLGGGLGLGVDVVAERLLARLPKVQVLAQAGCSQDVKSALEALAQRFPARLSVWEWSERMDIFLRAADIVVGKPGGLTVAEALACGRPLLATQSLRGQESFNVRFLQQHGVGGLLAEDELVGRIQALLADPAELSRIQERAWSLGRRDGAQQIAALALDYAWSPSRLRARSAA